MSDLSVKALNSLSNTRFTTYWLDSLEPVEDKPALMQDINCDLLVVGGGFCGLWAAIQAKEKDPERDVVLIEAKSVANGASGRPAAIMSTSVMHGIDNTERMFPDEVAELEKLGRENMDGFRQSIFSRAAIQAKEKDPERDVVLIEAKSVANGASGRPAAIMSTSVMHGIDNTERMFPDEVAELEKLGRENMDGFRQSIERYDIDCSSATSRRDCVGL